MSDKTLRLHMLSPVKVGAWSLLGELGKYTTVAKARFTSVRPAAGGRGLKVGIKGAAGERVDITALKPAGQDWYVQRRAVVVGQTGAATAAFT